MAYKIPAMIRDCTVEKNMAGTYLTWNDFTFAISLFLKNGAFYPESLLKFIRWIAFIRPYIDLYQPEYIIQYCEFSPYSSLRKLFLKRHNIKIANVAHGEVFISCRSAFSSFDQYFEWTITPSSMHDAMHIEYKDYFSFNPCEDLPFAPSVETPVLGFLWPGY